MNVKVSGKLLAMGSIVAAAAIAMSPFMAIADELSQVDAQAAEITSLKKQVYACHHPKRVRHYRHAARSAATTVFEKQTIIEKPIIVEKVLERVIEKQVVVEKQGDLILERPMEVERKVVVEHAARHKHLLHLGIPFISVNLF